MSTGIREVFRVLLEAARLPIRFPRALFKCVSLYLVFVISDSVAMNQSEALLFYSGRFENPIGYLNWNLRILHLLSLVALFNFAIGWMQLCFSDKESEPLCRWWNLNKRTLRFVLQSVGITIMIVVLFLISMVFVVPVALLGSLIGADAIFVALLGMVVELFLFWLSFQLMLAMVSSVVDDQPQGLFDAWILDDKTSIYCSLALYLVTKFAYCIQFALGWIANGTPITVLVKELFHYESLSGETVSGVLPLWVVLASKSIDVAYVIWISGFMAVAYRRFRRSDAAALHTIAG